MKQTSIKTMLCWMAGGGILALALLLMLGQVLEYRFPFGVMALYTGMLTVLELALTIWTLKKQQNRSLVHQIKGME